jgi:hypothetical protein
MRYNPLLLLIPQPYKKLMTTGKHLFLVWGLILASVLALGVSVPAEAQKNCRKGIPCGKSCISASKVCRIGSSAAEPMPRYDPPAAPARPSYVAPAPITATPAAAGGNETMWLGQPHGKVYYRASCQAAKELPEPIYFLHTADAERLGYQRSQVPGC